MKRREQGGSRQSTWAQKPCRLWTYIIFVNINTSPIMISTQGNETTLWNKIWHLMGFTNANIQWFQLFQTIWKILQCWVHTHFHYFIRFGRDHIVECIHIFSISYDLEEITARWVHTHFHYFKRFGRYHNVECIYTHFHYFIRFGRDHSVECIHMSPPLAFYKILNKGQISLHHRARREVCLNMDRNKLESECQIKAWQ